MIPNTCCNTNSSGERRVFDFLREAFEIGQSCEWTAFHSLSITRHATKRFGEVDFLVCGPQGIYVLEIKGGRIFCDNGKWATQDRRGVKHTLKESPFKQAETAMHALENRIREQMPDLHAQITFGYGAVFPDCDFQVRSSEWENWMFADSRGIRDIENWLKSLWKHWQARSHSQKSMDADQIKRLKSFLRPDFNLAMPLHVHVQNSEEKVVSLTADQMRALDMIEANERILCYGGAGTGKTFLAMELAQRWTINGDKVALLCRSPWLCRFLESCFKVVGLTISIVDSLKTMAKRADVEQFDRFIVDEGQDILDLETLDILDPWLKGGWESGSWCIFHDVNNQSGIIGTTDQDAIDFLKNCNPVNAPLKTNCRNTHQILDKVKKDLAADMGVDSVGDGPPIIEQHALSVEDAAKMLGEELKRIQNGGVVSGDITILSPLPFEKSCASVLSKKIQNQITVLDEYSVRDFPPKQISYATASEFKGLENKAIILVDFSPHHERNKDRTLLYVAMSRARALLSIITLDASDQQIP